MVEATFTNEYGSTEPEEQSKPEESKSEASSSGFSGWSMFSATASGLSSFFQKVKETTSVIASAASEDLIDMTNQLREDTSSAVECLFNLSFFLSFFP